MTLKNLSHVLIATLILVGTIAAYGVWYAAVSSKSARAVQLAQEIQTKRQDSARIRSAKDELVRLSNDEAQVAGYIVATADVVPFLQSLEATGKDLGASVEVVSVSANTAQPRSYLKLSLSITGPFTSVLRTLGAIEYGPYDITLQSLTLDTPQAGGGVAAQWTAAATFQVGTASMAQPAGTTASTTTP